MKQNNNKTKSMPAGENKKDKKQNKKAMISLAVATAVLGVTTLGFGIGFAVTDARAMDYGTKLENIYESNFYSLLDSVNNLENKLSKTLASNTSSYQRKTLLEASQNASEAEISVASLPLRSADKEDTIKLVNQVGGYTQTLADDLVDGEMSTNDRETLQEVHSSVLALKTQLNDFARKLENNYSILDASLSLDGDNNVFAQNLTALKEQNVEYPTMIYDGPFSDSVVNQEVKGVKGSVITKEEAKDKLLKVFKDAVSADYEGETNGRFETYNFRLKNSHGEMLFVQSTKIQGYILTVSGAGANGEASVDRAGAKEVALAFARENGIEGASVVWSDSINEDIYFNIAPSQSGIVLYPDLVKVKVNTVSGTVVGYDATSYFTNHKARALSKGTVSLSTAKGKVPPTFEVISSRVVLAPLDYPREVVCVEVEAESEGSTYYFYFNAENGDTENVLKVIETDNGNLLM